eukprot:CAMPEP_0185001992 /NCGR_PEP_ID=MMETSP1098-20130426/72609_1 /TAXON_ID=89044 /ORGANISM="Spumella elongata, Strain CCAP 955/1" /LENGTH=122 /DNA_ID=CAMNT_0027529389 /DNA_START=123 /DNA_END=491 /DNA_ORIENTATION=+
MSIKNISVVEFAALLNGPNRGSVQIVDVREKQELSEMALHGEDIINLPLSENGAWGRQVADGEILDPNKPIVCMCKAGGRSLKAATFFAHEAKFTDVTNVLGGITAYAAEVDQSVVRTGSKL